MCTYGQGILHTSVRDVRMSAKTLKRSCALLEALLLPITALVEQPFCAWFDFQEAGQNKMNTM